jgi:hypothetical protein
MLPYTRLISYGGDNDRRRLTFMVDVGRGSGNDFNTYCDPFVRDADNRQSIIGTEKLLLQLAAHERWTCGDVVILIGEYVDALVNQTQ